MNDDKVWERFRASLQVPETKPSEDFVSRVMERIPEDRVPALSGVEAFGWYRFLVPAFGAAAAALMLTYFSPAVTETASAESLLLSGADTETRWLFQAEAPSDDDALRAVVTEDL